MSIKASTIEHQTPPTEPILRLTVPTSIGKVCNSESSRYAMESVAILADHRNDNQVFLAATNGRALALVEADRERVGNPEAAGLSAAWLPRDIGKEGVVTWLSLGKIDTLFGTGIRWVIEHKGELRARDVPEGGQFPPFLDLLPHDLDDCEAITINASFLTELAAAISDGEFSPGITIFIPRGKQQRALRCVGNRGIGLIMPIDANHETQRAKWKGMRARIQVGRPMPAQIRDDGKMDDPEPSEVVDTETGKIIDRMMASTEALEALRPKPGSGIESVTISSGDKSVTLTPKPPADDTLEQAAQVLNDTGKVPEAFPTTGASAPVSPSDSGNGAPSSHGASSTPASSGSPTDSSASPAATSSEKPKPRPLYACQKCGAEFGEGEDHRGRSPCCHAAGDQIGECDDGDDGRDATSSTWDNRLTVSCGVANPKKINSQAAEHLRTAGYPTLNDVQSVRAVYADWRDRLASDVELATKYTLTPRQLDGLEEAIKTRLGQ